jgi:hypothetical protein
MLDFLIAGVQKGGTSALARFVSQHPEIATPSSGKEVHFFDNDKLFSGSSVPDYEKKYHRFFSSDSGAKQHVVSGEATPAYMFWKPCLKRIYEYNPEMKFIVVLRDPAERAFSQYKMERGRGREWLSFSLAIRIEFLRKYASFKTRRGQNRVYSYVERGFYAKQLKRLLKFYPRTHVLILTNFELDNFHDITLKRVFSFLDVDDDFKVNKERVFDSVSSEQIGNADRAYLVEKYREDIGILERNFGVVCSAWLRVD